VRIEGSWFNGREPDENRTDFDYTGRRLDSYSARITINPGAQWSLAAWYGYLDSPEALAPRALHRFGASALHSRPLGARGNWSTAFVYGANAAVGTGRTLGSALLETTVDADGTNAVFARLEYVKKRAEDLAVPGAASDVAYGVGAVSAGYTRELGRGYGAGVAVGARGAVSLVPAALASLYGSRSPVGAAVYLRVRPLSR